MTYKDLIDTTVDDVGKRTARLAEKKKRPELVIQENDVEDLKAFADAGVFLILVRFGIIKNYNPRKHETEINESSGEESRTGYYLSDYTDPDTLLDVNVPSECWNALTYHVLMEWFQECGEFDLSKWYRQKRDEEIDQYRFTPNSSITGRRAYRPMG